MRIFKVYGRLYCYKSSHSDIHVSLFKNLSCFLNRLPSTKYLKRSNRHSNICSCPTAYCGDSTDFLSSKIIPLTIWTNPKYHQAYLKKADKIIIKFAVKTTKI